jgi:hypothetical protein
VEEGKETKSILVNVDDKIVYAKMQNEVNLSRLYHNEKNEMEKLFHIKIQIKKNNGVALFN